VPWPEFTTLLLKERGKRIKNTLSNLTGLIHISRYDSNNSWKSAGYSL